MTATGDPADVVVPPPARHVVLIGLMGSGKTTVGRRLARLLDRGFVDADDALEELADRSIDDIFGSDGEDAFRALEAAVLAELLEKHRSEGERGGQAGGEQYRPGWAAVHKKKKDIRKN